MVRGSRLDIRVRIMAWRSHNFGDRLRFDTLDITVFVLFIYFLFLSFGYDLYYIVLRLVNKKHGQSRDKSEKKLYAYQPAVHLLQGDQSYCPPLAM